MRQTQERPDPVVCRAGRFTCRPRGAGSYIIVGVGVGAANAGSSAVGGWGTAISTDTAFALGMLALTGLRFHDRVRAFLLSVAVVDDLVLLAASATA